MTLTNLEPFQVGSDGRRIFLLDYAESRVYVLDSAGAVLDSLGRKGSGPGELQYPLALDVHDGVVAVTDMGTRRIVRWDTGGRLLDPVEIRSGLDHPMVLLRNGRLMYTIQAPVGTDAAEYRLIEGSGAEESTLARVAKQPRRIADFPSCGSAGISVQPLFAPDLRWDASDDRVAFVGGADYRIEMLLAGGERRAVVRPIAPVPSTSEIAEHEAAGWAINDCAIPPDEVVRATGFMPLVPVVRAIALSPSNDLWVLRRESGGTSAIDVFDSSGTLSGMLHDTPFPAAFMDDDRIVAVIRDSLDVPQIRVFLIDRLDQAMH